MPNGGTKSSETKGGGRRSFLKRAGAAVAGLGGALPFASRDAVARAANQSTSAASPPPFHLGLVTYELAKDWDIDTIIKNCEATGFEGVELRTTHKHGVEISLSAAQRAEVKQRFEGSRVRLMSLGTTCEFESPDAAVVE